MKGNIMKTYFVTVKYTKRNKFHKTTNMIILGESILEVRRLAIEAIVEAITDERFKITQITHLEIPAGKAFSI